MRRPHVRCPPGREAQPGHLTHSRQRPAHTGERATDRRLPRSIDATLGWTPSTLEPEVRSHVWITDGTDLHPPHAHAAIHWAIACGEVGLSGPVDSVRRQLVAALAALDHDIAAKRIPVEAAT